MGHKHGGQHNHGNPGQQAGDSPTKPLHVKLVPGENESAPKPDSYSDGGGGKREPPHIWPWPRWMGAPDWWIAGGTIALAIFAIGYFILLWRQLNDAQNNFTVDQRAWIDAKGIGAVYYKVGEKIVIPVRFQNSGKTPALHVETSMWVDVLPKGVDPNYDRTAPPISSGTVFPNTEFTTPTGSTYLLDQATDNDRINRTLWLYGTVTYCDIFNGDTVRRTEVCYYSEIVPPPGIMLACKATQQR